MANETQCQTDGAVYGIAITANTVICHVELPFPFPLNLTEDEIALLKTNLHNAIELVLARYWK